MAITLLLRGALAEGCQEKSNEVDIVINFVNNVINLVDNVTVAKVRP
jgi:hypothetical protein